MPTPSFRIDFNERLAPDLVLLSKGDLREAADGEMVNLIEGMSVLVWDEDFDERGERDDLFANGIVVRNTSSGLSQRVKWCCQIDENGVRHRSDLRQS
jgi:hypothetical protein